MAKVVITREFDGYPNGVDKVPVTFVVADAAVDVPDDFAQMIVGKGLARMASAQAATAAKASVSDLPAKNA